jgi:flavin reductase (DIM6/NTAB) family NADH-FMN oxidoreductase RutF
MASVDQHTFREVFSHLATGVTVITAHGEGGPTGMAANSVTSVSLDPPLLLVCAAVTSATWPLIRTSRSFCVNVMAGNQEPTVRRFASTTTSRFEGIRWDRARFGPALHGAIAHIGCCLEREVPAGDHVVALGRVLELEAHSGLDPLLFFRGSFGSFSPAAA